MAKGGVLTGVLCLLWMAAPACAGALDGVWFGGLQSGGDRLTLRAEILGEDGLVTTENLADPSGKESRVVGEVSPGRCTYRIRLEGMKIAASELVTGGAGCRARVGYEFQPVPEGLEILSDGTPLSFIATPSIVHLVLTRRVPPVSAAEMSALPAGFDALGVSTRQSLAEVEANLVGGRGWQRRDERVLKAEGWRRAERLYVRDGDETGGEPAESIAVVGGAVALDADPGAAPVLHVVHRRLHDPLGAPDPAAVAMALEEQYGPAALYAIGPDGGGSRYYDREGRWTEALGTAAGVEQGQCPDSAVRPPAAPQRVELPGAEVPVWRGCGSRVAIEVERDAGSGRAGSVAVTLWDYDALLADLWERETIGLRARLGGGR